MPVPGTTFYVGIRRTPPKWGAYEGAASSLKSIFSPQKPEAYFTVVIVKAAFGGAIFVDFVLLIVFEPLPQKDA